MTLPLPFLAAGTGGLMDTVTQISDEFGINVPGLLAQALNFALVAAVLWYFAFKPVISRMDERKQAIETGLKNAAEAKAKLDAAQQAVEAHLRDAQVKGQQLVAEAQKAAKDLADKQQQEAVEKAAGLIAKAQTAIELEKKKMLAEARTEIARLVVATTQRVLSKELSEAERARYNESAVRELTQV